MQKGVPLEKTTGVYTIQVASMLTGLHPQTLRKYEREGLISPAKVNNLRMYSQADIERLKFITERVREGFNIIGVLLILDIMNVLEDISLAPEATVNKVWSLLK